MRCAPICIAETTLANCLLSESVMKRWHIVFLTVTVILGAALLFGYRARLGFL